MHGHRSGEDFPFLGPLWTHLWFTDGMLSDHWLPGEVANQEKSESGNQAIRRVAWMDLKERQESRIAKRQGGQLTVVS